MDNLEQAMPMTDIRTILSSLNPEQRGAAVSIAQNIRTIAGPGTGKTKTMEARVANLIHFNVDPTKILALSFTNESSKEFKGRVQDTCGFKGHQVVTGTFHAVFNRVLRKYSSHDFFKTKLGYPEGFFIIDEDDAKKLLKESINSLPKGFKPLIDRLELKPKDFSAQMSLLRAKCHTPTTFVRQIIKDQEVHAKWTEVSNKLNAADSAIIDEVASEFAQEVRLRDFLLAKVWNAYTLRCRANHAIDFDDVLINTYYLLRHNPDIARKVAHLFEHVLVDEYQDTNLIQALIIRELKKANPKLCLFIVGDGRQAIYDFRGSDVSLMTEAQKYFGDFEDHELKTNYRSSNTLIESTNLFAKDMVNQITLGQLECGVDGIPNKLSQFHQFSSDIDEAKWVVDEINNQVVSGVSPDEIYVIYRNRAAARVVESELQKRHIHFEMVGERNFYERTEVRDALALFRAIVRPKDVLAWSRLVDAMPVAMRGMWLRDKQMQNVDKTPMDLIESRATGKNKQPIENWMEFHNLAHSLLRVEHSSLVSEYLVEDGAQISLDQAKHLIEFNAEARDAFNEWRNEFWSEIMSSLLERYVDLVQPAYLKADATKAKVTGNESASITTERLERVGIVFDEVRTRLSRGQSIFDIVDDLMTRDTKQREQTAEGVKLLTGHASKGLEAKVCFLVGCDTAIWQRGSQQLSNSELEEASRLYYVMATRAKEQNFYTAANSRYMYDKTVRSLPFNMIASHLKASQEKGYLEFYQHAQPSRFQTTSTEQSRTAQSNAGGIQGSNLMKAEGRFSSILKERFQEKTAGHTNSPTRQ